MLWEHVLNQPKALVATRTSLLQFLTAQLSWCSSLCMLLVQNSSSDTDQIRQTPEDEIFEEDRQRKCKSWMTMLSLFFPCKDESHLDSQVVRGAQDWDINPYISCIHVTLLLTYLSMLSCTSPCAQAQFRMLLLLLLCSYSKHPSSRMCIPRRIREWFVWCPLDRRCGAGSRQACSRALKFPFWSSKEWAYVGRWNVCSTYFSGVSALTFCCIPPAGVKWFCLSKLT